MIRKTIKGAAQLAVAVLLAACSADPTANVTSGPVLAASLADEPVILDPVILRDLVTLQPLQRRVPLAHDVRVEATIGAAGGTIRVPEAGFSVTVPRGAVKSSTRFAVTAVKGSQVAYEFEPHGVVFPSPLDAVQDLRMTQVPLLGATLKAGYFKERSQLTATSLGVLVSELIAGRIDPLRNTFRWNIEHFSGYIVAW